MVADATPAEVLANTGLLESANLIHSHRHLHGGVPHRHPSPFLRHEHRQAVGAGNSQSEIKEHPHQAN